MGDKATTASEVIATEAATEAATEVTAEGTVTAAQAATVTTAEGTVTAAAATVTTAAAATVQPDSTEANTDTTTTTTTTTTDTGADGSLKVAEHYNAVPQKGIAERTQSRIFYLRNFNNWIKSMLIGEFLGRLKEEGCPQATVLDLCCGKGGDLLKWRAGNVGHLVATDIASISMEQCESRYKEMRARDDRRPLYTAEFIVADATKDRLLDRYSNKSIKFDMCSCQFSFHYCFETERQTRFMIRNAVERLRPGGYFVGTLPDAERILYCIRNGQSLGTYSNDVLRLDYGDREALSDPDYKPPIFGAKFHFSLDTQVNCPEYLVHFPVLEKLLEECGMELVYKKRFPDAIDYYLAQTDGRGLMGRMQALEPYPATADVSLVANQEEYKDAEKRRQKILKEQADGKHLTVGTLSKSEWEVISMYIVFAFRRRKNTI